MKQESASASCVEDYEAAKSFPLHVKWGKTTTTRQAAKRAGGVGELRTSYFRKSMATKIVENDQDAQSEEAEENSPPNTSDSNSNVNTTNKKRRIESQNVTLIDPEVLDCYICCEPLAIPVFQCENGHVACFDCCSKNVEECPFCHMKIGDIRCRALENVLESLKGSCQNSRYGCKAKLTFDQRKEHLNTCSFGPCPCPLSDCEFVASSKKLYAHFNQKHPSSAINFQYYSSFTVDLKLDDKFLVLREKKVGVLFVLGSRTQPLGKAITMNCIGLASSKEGLSFELVMKTKETTLSLQSAVRGIKELVDELPPEEFLVIPKKFFGSNKQVKLELRIW